MKLSHVNFSDIQVFLTVAQLGSLVGAADKLDINHSTAFRWLKRFEEHIGHKLFDRSNNHYVLSEAGHAIFTTAENIVSEMTALSMTVDCLDNQLLGEVTVTSADAMVLGYLPEVIQRFHQAYPGLTIHLSSDNHFVNLAKREADIAIRPTHSPDENMVGRKAASMVFGLYASPMYVEKYGIPDIKAQGRGHRLCDYDSSLSHLNAAKWLKDHMGHADVVIKLASTVSLTQFAKAGMGLAAIPCFLADNDPNLVKVIEFEQYIASDIWILTHPDLRHSPKIRAVFDFIFDAIQKDEQHFLGRHI